MAEERTEGREITWQRLMPWTLLFRAFQVTVDLNKLLLAAGGILATWVAWWLLSVIFTATSSATPPEWKGVYESWQAFRADRQHWNLMNEAAGLNRNAVYEVSDIADTEEEYDLFGAAANDPARARERANELEKAGRLRPERAARYRALLGQPKPAGRLSVGPWWEDRGPNPYLLATGQAGVPWDVGGFREWFSRDQLPVMIEPLIKLGRPVVYFLSPRNTLWSYLYFLLVILATIGIWSFFGGAITRIAAVQVARGEKIGLFEAAGFTSRRYLSYITAPLFPIGLTLAFVILLGVLGFLGSWTWLTELIGGVLWFVPLMMGLVMTMALVGLITWPLMAATVSTEGTDSWEAATRGYGYLFQRPWHCLWYALVSVVYGGIVIFVVGFLGSMTVYMAKFGVSWMSPDSVVPAHRNPTYLFVYAPTSFGWRELLLEGAEAERGEPVVYERTFGARTGPAGVGGVSRHSRIDEANYDRYLASLSVYNKFGAVLVALWLYVAFVLILAFGYVFFWAASTIMYLLLRKSLEAAELDEVYLEEEDYGAGHTMPAAPAPAPPAAPSKAATLPVVEPPPRPAPPPQAPPAAPVAPSATEKVTTTEPTEPPPAPPEKGTPPVV
jgi:hypothetical protein